MKQIARTWRPRNSIEAKAIGLAKHEGRLLVCEILNDDGSLKGWRPLGGGIEFGETAEAALKREFLEEMGANIRIMDVPIVCENIFEHHGAKGHEIIFAFPISFEDSQIYAKDRFQIFEHTGSVHWAEWIAIKRFQKGEFILFPPLIAKILF